MAQTNERAFESRLEQMLGEGGWQTGKVAEWDKARALFPARLFDFIEATQAKLWREMAALHGDHLKPMLLDALVKELDIKGALHVLRRGSSSTASCSDSRISSRRTRCRPMCLRCTATTRSA